MGKRLTPEEKWMRWMHWREGERLAMKALRAANYKIHARYEKKIDQLLKAGKKKEANALTREHDRISRKPMREYFRRMDKAKLRVWDLNY